VLEVATAGRDAGGGVVGRDRLARILSQASLGEDQSRAVERLCLAGERIAVLVGPAGSGKTKALAAARSAWEEAGMPVRGLAPSAVAAGVLAEQAGVPAETLAKFLHEHARDRVSLRPGEVVVLDEAAMVSTKDLARLVELVQGAEGKLVLVGDHHQLSSVGAGGLFRLLVKDAKVDELGAVHRFTETWEAGASRRLREGQELAIAEYEARARVTGGSREDVMEAAYRSWAKARSDGASVVVMAPDHDTVDALALRCRGARVAAGEVEPGGVRAGDQVVGRGDEVVTTKNARRLLTSGGAWVRNGDRWQVTERRSDGSLVVSSPEGRGRVVLPSSYVAEHMALAYAVTVHKAQGLTVDRAVLVVDRASTAEHLYVGMTRGCSSNFACVVCEPADPDHGRLRRPSPHDVLVSALRRSGAERSATEVLRAEQGRVEDLDTLRAALGEARRRIDAASGPDRFDEIVNLRQMLPRYEGAEERLRGAERALAKAQDERRAAEEELHRARMAEREAARPRGWRRRPDEATMRGARADSYDASCRGLGAEQAERRGALDVQRHQGEVDQMRQTKEALERAEAAQGRRGEWMAAHPAEMAWVADLACRITARRQEEAWARAAPVVHRGPEQGPLARGARSPAEQAVLRQEQRARRRARLQRNARQDRKQRPERGHGLER
ncbi:MAG: AAA family ATPase, partial [Acidimicrobiales bacterium]